MARRRTTTAAGERLRLTSTCGEVPGPKGARADLWADQTAIGQTCSGSRRGAHFFSLQSPVFPGMLSIVPGEEEEQE